MPTVWFVVVPPLPPSPMRKTIPRTPPRTFCSSLMTTRKMRTSSLPRAEDGLRRAGWTASACVQFWLVHTMPGRSWLTPI